MSSITLGLIQPLYADGSPGQPTFYIQQVNPDFPAEKLAGPNTTVLSRKATAQHSELPDPVQRDDAFKAAGVSSAVTTWDNLDRDMFYVRVQRSAKFEPLVLAYPSVPAEKLRSLWQALHKKDKSQ